MTSSSDTAVSPVLILNCNVVVPALNWPTAGKVRATIATGLLAGAQLMVQDKILAEDAAMLVALAGVLVPLLIAIVSGSWRVYKHLADRTAMGKHPKLVDHEFPERNYKQRREILCRELRDDLRRMDSETSWSRHHFVPLDADVDVLKGDHKRRQVMDLLAGIRTNRRSRLFLIIGDPGSGKSVALRTLCRDLLREVSLTGKIPIYINLREWSEGVDWTRQHPPTEAELRRFLFRNIRARISYKSRHFLNTYFEKMLDDGHLFLVLDSFDEIPRVMDAAEASWLIKELSQIITRVLAGGDKGRGVVASRYFRRPRFTREDVTVLEIRPFNELKIASAIDRATGHADVIKRALFRERPDLAPLARNPFVLGLIIDFCEENPGQLPKTQAELYEHFVAHSFRLAREEMHEYNLDQPDVLTCASSVAMVMFRSDQHGNEIRITTLREQLPNMPIDAVVAFLVAARIGRRSGAGATFGFSHRRFSEYFLIKVFREHALDALTFESIATDGRWRDPLALFAEVAEEPTAKSIASYCWGEILRARRLKGEVGNERYLRGLHSLRFLATAFRGRRDILAEIEAELGALVYQAVLGERNSDILVAKHALEAAGVLSDKSAERVIAAALASGNYWLVESAFRACRYLVALPVTTKTLIIDHLLRLPATVHLQTYAETIFSLRITDGLSIVRWIYYLRHVDLLISMALLPIIGLLSPVFLLLSLLLAAIIYALAPRPFLGLFRGDFFSLVHLGSVFWCLPFGLFVLDYLRSDEYLLMTGSPFYLLFWTPLKYVQYWDYLSGQWKAVIVASIYAMFVVRPANLLAWAVRGALAICLKARARTLSRDMLRVAKAMIVSILRAGAFIGALIGVGWAVIRYTSYWDYVWGANIAFLAAFMLLLAVTRVYEVGCNTLHDVRVLSDAKQDFDGTRATINSVFLKFRTSSYRLKYARWLGGRSTSFQVRLASRENGWPCGRRPNLGDTASILLAQLDERWLGLDR